MKKTLLPLSLGLLLAASASAQITLTQSSFSYANVRGGDTLLNTVTNPTYPALTAATGGNLDFTTTTSTASTTVLYRVAGTGTNQWADSATLSFSGFPYKAKQESSLSATAYQQNGEHIDRAAFSLQVAGFPLTTATDSLVINGQDIPFSAARTRIAFPAANQSTWSSSYKYDFDFTLTFAALSLNDAAGIVRAFVTEKDTVIGYGKVRVNDKNGNPTGYQDVLQIETITTTTDSFYLNGAPASTTILAAFQVTQGQSIVTKDQYYFRAGQISPLVHITYDPTNTTPATAQTQADSLTSDKMVFIPETKLTSTLNVYPNPVTNHTIVVSGATANYGNWSYQLEGVNGQVVTQGALQLNSNNAKTNIALPTSIAPGTYFLHMNNGGTQEAVKTLTIQ